MIVKFFTNSGGGSSGGAMNYLLGKDRDREHAKVLRGDVDITSSLIDQSMYAKAYTSGCLSFSEQDITPEKKTELMDSFERTLMHGLEEHQYNFLWVEHRDKGRLELNFVIPNVELTTGKRLQPFYSRADKPLVNAWKDMQNIEHGFTDPNDPQRKQSLTLDNVTPQTANKQKELITNGIAALVGKGLIKSREDVIKTLENNGFTVARATDQSISLVNPQGGRNLRLKGAFYERSFQFSRELCEELRADSREYGASSQERYQEARAVLDIGLGKKWEYNQERYNRIRESRSNTLSTKGTDLRVGEPTSGLNQQHESVQRADDSRIRQSSIVDDGKHEREPKADQSEHIGHESEVQKHDSRRLEVSSLHDRGSDSIGFNHHGLSGHEDKQPDQDHLRESSADSERRECPTGVQSEDREPTGQDLLMLGERGRTIRLRGSDETKNNHREWDESNRDQSTATNEAVKPKKKPTAVKHKVLSIHDLDFNPDANGKLIFGIGDNTISMRETEDEQPHERTINDSPKTIRSTVQEYVREAIKRYDRVKQGITDSIGAVRERIEQSASRNNGIIKVLQDLRIRANQRGEYVEKLNHSASNDLERFQLNSRADRNDLRQYKERSTGDFGAKLGSSIENAINQSKEHGNQLGESIDRVAKLTESIDRVYKTESIELIQEKSRSYGMSR